MPQIKKQRVITKLVSKLRIRQHLHPRPVVAVNVNDGPSGLPCCRRVPSLQINTVSRIEFDIVVLHPEVRRSFPVQRIAIMKTAGTGDARQEPWHDAVEKHHHGHDQKSQQPLGNAPQLGTAARRRLPFSTRFGLHSNRLN